LRQIQHDENGREKLLWPILETDKGSRLNINSGIYEQNPTGKNIAVNIYFLGRET